MLAHAFAISLLLGGQAEVSAGDAGYPRIDWHPGTLTLIQAGASYGRMIRLTSGEILCAYFRRGKIWVRISPDDGRTWRPERMAASDGHGVATNPEILLLDSGRILMTYNRRPRDGVHRFAIMSCFSRDSGQTWTDHHTLHEADTRFENGCWEPAQIQLVGGEIQLFFANEGPYRATDEQEITLLRSLDRGVTWNRPKRVSFRAQARDGMPVPLVLADGGGIVVAIEDNGRGAFQPAIVHSPMDANWWQGHANGDSPRRWYALETALPPGVYAGAPYIRQLATGETVLSVQSAEGRLMPSSMKRSRMVVYIGDSQAKQFSGRSVPFDVPPNKNGLWNSLFIKGESTVTAVSSTAINGVHGLWVIDGEVKRPE